MDQWMSDQLIVLPVSDFFPNSYINQNKKFVSVNYRYQQLNLFLTELLLMGQITN